MRSLVQRPNLPPQQSSDNQVKIGGEIRLACASGRRMRTQYEQATPGKRGNSPAHQLPEPSLHPVANYRRPDRTADNQAYLRLGVALYRTDRKEHVRGDRGTISPATRAHSALEVVRAPHPRLLWQHCTSRGQVQPAGTLPAPVRFTDEGKITDQG
jgi:hypothetical protein